MAQEIAYVEGPNDMSPVREVEYNDRKFTLKQDEVFGHWTIHMPKGPTPDKLQGTWTTFEKARQAIQNWANNNPPDLPYHKAVEKRDGTLEVPRPEKKTKIKTEE